MKMKFAHWQMILKRINAYLFFVLAVLVRRTLFDRLKPDRMLIAEISAVGFFLLLSFLKWLFFRYGFDGKEFVIEKGILIKRRTVIPADNLSTVDFDMSLSTLMFGAVILRIDTEAGCYKRSDFEFSIHKKDRHDVVSVFFLCFARHLLFFLRNSPLVI